MKNNKVTRKLNSLLSTIEIRLKSAQEQFERDQLARHWSQLSGWDGIQTGLLMVKHDIETELREINRKKIKKAA